ncbi:hypothetical protein T492DRAFT_854427, partial [Pavlovales sp. CCMP2436]
MESSGGRALLRAEGAAARGGGPHAETPLKATKATTMLLPAAAAVGPYTETPLKATKVTKTMLLPAAATTGLRRPRNPVETPWARLHVPPARSRAPRFHDALFARLSLVVQPAKCECWIDEAHIDSLDTHRGLVTRSHLLDGVTPYYGVMCYGISIGSEEYIKLALDGKCDEIACISTKLITSLSSSHKQQLWLLTLFSTARKFEYFARHCHPDHSREACTRFDAIIHAQATHALGVSLDDD